MRRTHRHVSLLLLGAVVLSACGSSSDSRSSVSTVEDGTLTACTDMPYEPFEYVEDGRERGIDVELVRAIGADMGLNAQFRQVGFDDIFDALDDGECDLVASAVSITEERQSRHLFSDPYFEVNQSILMRQEDADPGVDLSAFAQRKVGVQAGTTGAGYAADHLPSEAIVEFDDVGEMAEALKDGQIDGVIQDFPINSWLARNSAELTVARSFTDIAREEYGFAMRRGAGDLRQRVNRALAQLRDSGEYDRILREHLGSAE